jgi:hypothetical protein
MTPLTKQELEEVLELLQQGHWYRTQNLLKSGPDLVQRLTTKIRKQQQEIANLNAHQATIKELTCKTEKL